MDHTGPIVQLHVSQLLACPYLEGRNERKLFTPVLGPDATRLYGELQRAGFRRSHEIAYRPACPGCNACVPVRVDVARFHNAKWVRRVRNTNSDLRAGIGPARGSEEHYGLFRRHLENRHDEGGMLDMDFADYRDMVEATAITSRMAEFRDTAGTLVAACLYDITDDGLSAVYSYFETTQDRRSLGTYIVIWLIDQAREQRKPYVYLGYWIADSPKMAYKARFRPLESFTGGRWQDMAPQTEGDCAAPGADAILRAQGDRPET